LKKIVDSTFREFDLNRDNFIDKQEAVNFLNMGLKQINKKPNATFLDAEYFIKSADKNGDGVLSRSEVEDFFKTIIHRSQ
jgi:Ca2+-binding EF-hand superfamily protein